MRPFNVILHKGGPTEALYKEIGKSVSA